MLTQPRRATGSRFIAVETSQMLINLHRRPVIQVLPEESLIGCLVTVEDVAHSTRCPESTLDRPG